MDNKFLKKVWDKATPPNISDLQSTYVVVVHSGPFKYYSNSVWVWEKTITQYTDPKSPRKGKNYINCNYEGYFQITKDQIPGLPKGEVYLDYGKSKKNKAKWDRMVDAIRIVEPGLLIGKIYIRLFGSKFFPTYVQIGYFSLCDPMVVFNEKTFSVKPRWDVVQGNHD